MNESINVLAARVAIQRALDAALAAGVDASLVLPAAAQLRSLAEELSVLRTRARPATLREATRLAKLDSDLRRAGMLRDERIAALTERSGKSSRQVFRLLRLAKEASQ